MTARFYFYDFRETLCLYRPKKKQWCSLHATHCPSKRKYSLHSTMPKANLILTRARRELFKALLTASLAAAAAFQGMASNITMRNAA